MLLMAGRRFWIVFGYSKRKTGGVYHVHVYLLCTVCTVKSTNTSTSESYASVERVSVCVCLSCYKERKHVNMAKVKFLFGGVMFDS